MTTSIGVDLGVCDAFLSGDERCQGRLIVDRESGGLLEAVCSSCGEVAARPVRDGSGAPEREEQWWDK